MAQTIKNPPAMQEIWVQFLGWEDPPGKFIKLESYFLFLVTEQCYIFVIESLLLRTCDVPHCGLVSGNIDLNRTDKISVLIT